MVSCTPTETTPGPSTSTAPEAVNVSIWHDNDETMMNTIGAMVNAQLVADNITVTFVKKAGLNDQLMLYGNDEVNGPDLYFAAHDTVGSYATMGILAPATDFVDQSFFDTLGDTAVEAGKFSGIQYLVPSYSESLVFVYNKDRWEGTVPATMDGLYEYAVAHTDTAANSYGFLNQYCTAYNMAAFVNAYGGFWLNAAAQPGIDNIHTTDAIKYYRKFVALQGDGDYNTIHTLFNGGHADSIMTGPWAISGMKSAGLDIGYQALSDFTLPDGRKVAPYAGVQSFGILKKAAKHKDAIGKVLRAASAKNIGVKLAADFNCATSNKEAQQDGAVAANEMIACINRTLEEAAVPTPSNPEMNVVWQPAEQFLTDVYKSGADIDQSAATYQQNAEELIANMQ